MKLPGVSAPLRSHSMSGDADLHELEPRQAHLQAKSPHLNFQLGVSAVLRAETDFVGLTGKRSDAGESGETCTLPKPVHWKRLFQQRCQSHRRRLPTRQNEFDEIGREEGQWQ